MGGIPPLEVTCQNDVGDEGDVLERNDFPVTTLKLTIMAVRKEGMSNFDWRSLCTEEAGLLHKVGGWYLTRREQKDLIDVMILGKSPRNIPCRIRSMAAYFVDKDVAKCGEFVTSKMSFRLSTANLDEFEGRYKIRGPPHYASDIPPINHFLSDILRESEVVDVDFIRKNCLSLPICGEHKVCKEIHSKLPAHLVVKFTCCNRESCDGEFNATTMYDLACRDYGVPIASIPFSDIFNLKDVKLTD